MKKESKEMEAKKDYDWRYNLEEGDILKIITRGIWMQRANTYFYKVVGFRKTNPYKAMYCDYLLVKVGTEKLGEAYVGDDFDTLIIENRLIQEYLQDIQKGKEVDTFYGWITLLDGDVLSASVT